jgi:hypothetical protein
LALRHAARQRWAFGHNPAILSLFKGNVKNHPFTLFIRIYEIALKRIARKSAAGRENDKNERPLERQNQCQSTLFTIFLVQMVTGIAVPNWGKSSLAPIFHTEDSGRGFPLFRVIGFDRLPDDVRCESPVP